MQTVEAVIINWRRPQNVRRIVDQFRLQSVPCRITLCDAADVAHALDAATLSRVDRLYTLRENHGSFNRYIPAFGFDCQYTYFHDDDMLPGTKVVEHFLRAARCWPDGAAFGQQGRIIGDRYRGEDVPRSPDSFVPVHMLIRGYFVRTEYLLHLKRFQLRLGEPAWEDDILLALGIQAYTNKAMLLTPATADREEPISLVGRAR